MGEVDKTQLSKEQLDALEQVKVLQEIFKEAAESIAEGAETLDDVYSDWKETLQQLERANEEIFEDSRSLSWLVLLTYFLLGATIGAGFSYWWGLFSPTALGF
ncbi:MAG: hypothetical protein RBT72_10055 [Spirochaetia bacterium]|jgi:hypothetical protein|nr:hypothetical protein [Spirochaetia bacterium]